MIEIVCLFVLNLYPLSVHHVFDNLLSGRRRQREYLQEYRLIISHIIE